MDYLKLNSNVLSVCKNNINCDKELLKYIRVDFSEDSNVKIIGYNEVSAVSTDIAEEVIALLGNLEIILLEIHEESMKLKIATLLNMNLNKFQVQINSDILPVIYNGKILASPKLSTEKRSNKSLLTMIGFLFGILLSISVVFLRGCDED